jgi:hypothetical protein
LITKLRSYEDTQDKFLREKAARNDEELYQEFLKKKRAKESEKVFLSVSS